MEDQPDYKIEDYAHITKNWNENPTTYLERYYTLHYKIVDKEQDSLNEDIYVRQSPNKICVIGIVNPPVNVHSVVMNDEIIGKNVKKDTILCVLRDAELNRLGVVRANMEGKLLELNARYEEEGISLLQHGFHMDTGFIAIVLPKVDETKVQLRGYLTEQEYILHKQNKRPNLEKKSSSCNIS